MAYSNWICLHTRSDNRAFNLVDCHRGVQMNRNIVRQWFRRAIAIQSRLEGLRRAEDGDEFRVGDVFVGLPTLLITPEVGEVLGRAVFSWVPEKMDHSDLGEWDLGFAYFTSPLVVNYSEGPPIQIQAVAWSMGKESGVVAFIGFPRSGDPISMEYGFSLALTALDFELPPPDDEGSPYAICAVLWRFLQQRVAMTAQPARGHVDSKTSARKPIDTLRIVTLRRPKYKRTGATDGNGREYSHRWWVHGHWANLWHPSIQMNRQHWIEDYIKGPEDKPLVLKDSVYLVKR